MKTAVVVTGASRGFGRCLALDFCREIADSDIDMVRHFLHRWGACPMRPLRVAIVVLHLQLVF
jgi:NAD(P)-dependent dehydrogenase (short-subunit alcohol dehydrogenase family)